MVRLEYFDKKDFKQLIEWMNSEHLMTNWAGSLFRYPLTEDSLDWYLEDTNNLDKSDAFVYKAIDIETGETVGHISLGGISPKNRAARISRVLVGDTAERGKGYCTGMIAEILKIGFEELKLHRISLGVYDFNHAAIKCYERCGFVREGVMRDVLQYEEGNYWSLIEMGILEDEWRTWQKTKNIKKNLQDCKDCQQ
jgi:RimJ/RimL family protein N-acetyltransferase